MRSAVDSAGHGAVDRGLIRCESRAARTTVRDAESDCTVATRAVLFTISCGHWVGRASASPVHPVVVPARAKKTRVRQAVLIVDSEPRPVLIDSVVKIPNYSSPRF
jgi:hypothetical protein